MNFEQSPIQRLEALKKALSRFVFAQVERTITHEEDLLSHNFGEGMTYRTYFGFAQSEDKRYYFNNKSRCGTDLLGLGIMNSSREPRALPRTSEWLVAIPGSNDGKPYCKLWQVCTLQEKMFTDCLLGRADELLSEPDSFMIPEPANDFLVKAALVLFMNDHQYFLHQRTAGTPLNTDFLVKEICVQFHAEKFWREYEEKALAQHVYSRLIRESAPQPIKNRVKTDDSPSVGLTMLADALA